MKIVTLTRLWTGRWGTFGRLGVGDLSPWWAVERPKTGDHPCIPAGTYDFTPDVFYGGDGPGGKADYACYEVRNVPGRAEIKAHVANLASELRGCIAPGQSVAWFPQWKALGVSGSGAAFKAFMLVLNSEDATLKITEEL